MVLLENKSGSFAHETRASVVNELFSYFFSVLTGKVAGWALCCVSFGLADCF